MTPLFKKHMDNIMSGEFSKIMMEDWSNNDKDLLKWRSETADTSFEKTKVTDKKIPEQEYFDNGILMVAFVRAERRIAELKDKLRQNADKRRMEKSYKKPASDKLEEVMAAPTNNVGGGKIAGTVEAGDNPPVKKKKRYIYGGTGSRKMWMTKK